MNAPGKLTVNKGHGPKDNGTFDPGAIGPTGLKESTQNQEIGALVIADMRRNGWKVLDIQDGDLDDVTDVSNAWVPQYFLSIHTDSFSDPTAHGITTCVQALGGWAERIAREVQKEMILATGLTDRGVKVANLHVTRETDGPALLVECGFISNPKEEALMKDPKWDQTVASAICRGLSRAVNVPYSEAVKPVTAPYEALTEASDPDVNLVVWVAESKVPKAIQDIERLGFHAEQFPLKLRRD